MMRVVETRTYQIDLTSEDRKKFREVIEFLDSFANEISPHRIEVKDIDGDTVVCDHYNIDVVVALLTGFEEDNYRFLC